MKAASNAAHMKLALCWLRFSYTVEHQWALHFLSRRQYVPKRMTRFWHVTSKSRDDLGGHRLGHQRPCFEHRHLNMDAILVCYSIAYYHQAIISEIQLHGIDINNQSVGTLWEPEAPLPEPSASPIRFKLATCWRVDMTSSSSSSPYPTTRFRTGTVASALLVWIFSTSLLVKRFTSPDYAFI